MTEVSTVQIRVAPELWATSIMPQGVLQKWLRPDGTLVEAGEPVASVRIEDSLHELMAPVSGWLRTGCAPNSVVEPGMVIGHLGVP
jgi:hypothetical protein